MRTYLIFKPVLWSSFSQLFNFPRSFWSRDQKEELETQTNVLTAHFPHNFLTILHSNSVSFPVDFIFFLSTTFGLSFSRPHKHFPCHHSYMTQETHVRHQHYRLSSPLSHHHCTRPWQTRPLAVDKKSYILSTSPVAAEVPISPFPVPPISFYFQSIPDSSL